MRAFEQSVALYHRHVAPKRISKKDLCGIPSLQTARCAKSFAMQKAVAASPAKACAVH
jgi:hypothetical protein